MIEADVEYCRKAKSTGSEVKESLRRDTDPKHNLPRENADRLPMHRDGRGVIEEWKTLNDGWHGARLARGLLWEIHDIDELAKVNVLFPLRRDHPHDKFVVG